MTDWKLARHPRFAGRARAGRGLRHGRRRHRARTTRATRSGSRARRTSTGWPQRARRAPRSRARHRGRHAERRRHGQQRGRPQRARRRPRLRPGREARRTTRSPTARLFARRRLAAADRRACARARRAAALHRPALRRQRAQPHRPPVRAAPTRCDAEDVAARARARAARRPRRARDAARSATSTRSRSCSPTLAQRGGRDYRIASGGGRMLITMDRYEADWRMVERGWQAHVLGEARAVPERARGDRDASTRENPGISDQNLPAFVDRRTPHGSRSGRSATATRVVLFNFRGDRAIEISRAFEDEAFPHFDRGRAPRRALRRHDAVRRRPARAEALPGHAAGDRAHAGRVPGAQRRRASSRSARPRSSATSPTSGTATAAASSTSASETYVEIPSRPAAVRGAAVDEGRRDHRRADRRSSQRAATATRALNYANGDMVGHTGDRDATVLAVEAVDLQLGRLLPAIAAARRRADRHRRSRQRRRDVRARPKTGELEARRRRASRWSKTSHTLNRVPFHVYRAGRRAAAAIRDVASPGLANVAATVLQLMGWRAPDDYAPSLIKD